MDALKGAEGIAALIVGLAIIATLVAPKAQTAKVAGALGQIFTGGITAAKA